MDSPEARKGKEDVLEQIFTSPQTLGLIIDIFGAFYIARSFIFSNPKSLIAQAWGSDYPEEDLVYAMSGNLFRGFYKQATDAKIGFVLLTLGFGGQFISSLFPNFRIAYCVGILIVILALFLPLAFFHVFFKSSRLNKIESETDKSLSS